MGEPNSRGVLTDGTRDPRSFVIFPQTNIELDGIPKSADSGGITFFLAHGVFGEKTLSQMKAPSSRDRVSHESSTVESRSIRVLPDGRVVAVTSILVLPASNNSQNATLLKAAAGTSVFAVCVPIGDRNSDGMPRVNRRMSENPNVLSHSLYGRHTT